MNRLVVFVVVPLLLLVRASMAQEDENHKPGKVSIDSREVSLDEFIKRVSSDLNLRILYDEKVLQRKVNLLSPSDVPRDKLFDVLLSVLEMQNFTMVKSGPPEAEVWKVVPLQTPTLNPAMKGVLKTVALDNIDKLPTGEEMATLVVSLKHLDARSAFIAVQGMVSDPRMVQAIEPAGVIVVTDTAQNLRRIGEAVRLMDHPSKAQGQASLSVESYLFDVLAQDAKAGEKEDTDAFRRRILAAVDGEKVRLLHHWSGRTLDQRPIDSRAAGKALQVRLVMTPSLPSAAAPHVPGAKEGAPAPPGPSEGDVALSATIDVTLGAEGGSTQTTDTTTLAGKEGGWLFGSVQSAAEEGRVRLFFAKVER